MTKDRKIKAKEYIKLYNCTAREIIFLLKMFDDMINCGDLKENELDFFVDWHLGNDQKW